jgi:hypothetical protein
MFACLPCGDEMSAHFDSRLILGCDEELQTFMAETVKGVVVDWREEEEEIVRIVSEAISPDTLSCEWQGEDDLVLLYKDRRRPVGLTFSMRDRYICLRAINDILSGEYELRLFEPSFWSDTHQFLAEAAAWWDALDRQHSERSRAVFRKIDAGLDFP